MCLLSRIQIAAFFAVAPAWPVALADNAGSTPNSGQSVYEKSCKSCHSGGIGGFFSGAPKIGDKNEWAQLIAKGVPALIESTVNGIGDMTPKGGCETCTDSDVAAAVEYMVGESR
jgi:cytochrome c5